MALSQDWIGTGLNDQGRAYTGVMTVADDLSQLREQFPDWRFGTVWATAATGPDQRRVWATRDAVTVTAWNAAELAQKVRREQTTQ